MTLGLKLRLKAIRDRMSKEVERIVDADLDDATAVQQLANVVQKAAIEIAGLSKEMSDEPCR